MKLVISILLLAVSLSCSALAAQPRAGSEAIAEKEDTLAPYEAAARELCKLRNLDPDRVVGLVLRQAEPGEVCAGADSPDLCIIDNSESRPQWRDLALEIATREHAEKEKTKAEQEWQTIRPLLPTAAPEAAAPTRRDRP